MRIQLPKGAFPTMITPFTSDNKIDYSALKAQIEWYLANGVAGLFAVCQSSEMFYLSLEERVALSKFVVDQVDHRVSVIASGHISADFSQQREELDAIADTGVDAVVMITCRLAHADESDKQLIQNTEKLLSSLKSDYPLGLYECPYPYKRVISHEVAKYLASCGRFSFLKDTSCDINSIRDKLEVFEGSGLQLYNANTATLLESLRLGAAGFCGVMGNFHPRLYKHLCEHYYDENAEKLSDELTMLSYIEKQLYPVNAKYYLGAEGLPVGLQTRSVDPAGFTEGYAAEVNMLRRITYRMYEEYLPKGE